MLISKEIKNIDGVTEVLVGMGTDLNKELTLLLNLNNQALDDVGANDFFVTAEVTDECVMTLVLEKVELLLTQKKKNAGSDYQPATLLSAIEKLPEANMLLVSIAGQYAEDEVMNALDQNLNVMLFSDNVSIESELRMKKRAVEKELLMMGPDCGTAIINGIPLCFANVVSRGPIGVVGASGTGTQEVTCLIDQLGAGVSQVIGTGGRDLKVEIGGLMMLQGFEALINDPNTEVIVLISKPPAKEVAEKILSMVKTTQKPVVVDFIGGDPAMIRAVGAYPCLTLEDAAHKAVALSRGEKPIDFTGFSLPDTAIDALAEKCLLKLKPDQRILRGLYTGGTLADEAMKMLGNSIGGIYSNIPLEPQYALDSLKNLLGHVILDLGEDQFTVGRPHPMIDPSTRTDRLMKDVDSTVAVLLFDVVLGYGSHENPAKEVADAIIRLQEQLQTLDKSIIAVASITGTQGDPQGFESSKALLESVGVVVMPSNAQAVRFVQKLMLKIKSV
jgi:succinyl-CoA synthetase alpha subunit